MSILDFASTSAWAMEKAKADQLVEIAERYHTVSPHALESYKAQSLDRAQRAKVRDGTALLYAEGPLFKKANLFVEISGATSYEILAKDLQVALDDPNVHSIMSIIDSPGGEANGCDELAAAIRAASAIKPTMAYVSGMAASGGYWIASASETIWISEAALLGSIGVVLGMRDTKGAEERSGVKSYEFVSSQSPGKRPDPGSAEGSSQIQTMVDDMADVFIGNVASYRGVTPAQVVEKFGAGGLKVGAKAVASGMADKVGSFEAAFSDLNARGKKGRNSNRSFGGPLMSDNTNTGPTADEIAASARTSTQARIKGILNCDNGKALPALANHLAFDTEISSADCEKILAAASSDVPKAAAQPQTPAQPETPAQSFDERRAEAGSLGLGTPDLPKAEAEQQQVAAGWGKAVSAANQSHFKQ